MSLVETAPPAQLGHAQEAMQQLRETIQHLPPEEKEVFLLRQNGELTYEQIARLDNRPVEVVKEQMRSAPFGNCVRLFRRFHRAIMPGGSEQAGPARFSSVGGCQPRRSEQQLRGETACRLGVALTGNSGRGGHRVEPRRYPYSPRKPHPRNHPTAFLRLRVVRWGAAGAHSSRGRCPCLGSDGSAGGVRDRAVAQCLGVGPSRRPCAAVRRPSWRRIGARTRCWRRWPTSSHAPVGHPNLPRTIRRSAPDLPAISEAIQGIQEEVGQVVRLVDDLLDATRISRGKVALRRERLNLGAVIERAVRATGPLLASRNHQLAVSVPPEPVYLDADPLRLQQVVVNLLDNAAKYTNPGGRIWLTVILEGEEAVVLRVRDTGIGISRRKGCRPSSSCLHRDSPRRAGWASDWPLCGTCSICTKVLSGCGAVGWAKAASSLFRLRLRRRPPERGGMVWRAGVGDGVAVRVGSRRCFWRRVACVLTRSGRLAESQAGRV